MAKSNRIFRAAGLSAVFNCDSLPRALPSGDGYTRPLSPETHLDIYRSSEPYVDGVRMVCRKYGGVHETSDSILVGHVAC